MNEVINLADYEVFLQDYDRAYEDLMKLLERRTHWRLKSKSGESDVIFDTKDIVIRKYEDGSFRVSFRIDYGWSRLNITESDKDSIINLDGKVLWDKAWELHHLRNDLLSTEERIKNVALKLLEKKLLDAA